jgi:hypothetical protein
MTNFLITVDGALAGKVVVDDQFKVEIETGDDQLTQAVQDHLTTELGVQWFERIGPIIAATTAEMVVPVDDPAALEIALLDLSRSLSEIYPNGEDVEVDGDWSIFEEVFV